jgi:hypothetical protein
LKKRYYLLITFILAIVLFVAVLLVLHMAPGQRFLVGQVKAYLEDNHDISFELDNIEYNLLSLSASVNDLLLGSVSQSGLPEFLKTRFSEKGANTSFSKQTAAI